MSDDPAKLMISIGTVCRNAAETIERTFKSVDRQTYGPIEYIVVDGLSTDGTQEMISKYDYLIDKWVSEPDSGIYDAMNKAIGMCSGDVIGLLNADDWLEKGALVAVAQSFMENPEVHMIHGAVRNWNPDGSVHSVYTEKGALSPLYTCPFNHPTCFFRREAYTILGAYDQTYPTAADYDLLLRFQNKGMKSLYLDRVLVNFAMTGITSQTKWSPYGQINNLLRKNGFSFTQRFLGVGFRLMRDFVSFFLSFGKHHGRFFGNGLNKIRSYRGDENA